MHKSTRRSIGQKIDDIVLPSLDNATFSLDHIAGKRFMLSFFRFAACPFCNLRLHELVKHYPEFGKEFTIVAVFDASPANLRRHAQRHAAPFPILADAENIYYHAFGIERSVMRTFVGAILRLPTVLQAILGQGFWPSSFGGNLTTMPADFLVDQQRIIRHAHYGADEGDHLPLETIQTFALSNFI